MDEKTFKTRVPEIVDMALNFPPCTRERAVYPDTKDGYFLNSISNSPPQHPISFEDLKETTLETLSPGLFSGRHPLFNAYFSFSACYESLLADILDSCTVCLAGHATTGIVELEMKMCDWFGTAINLPPQFLYSGKTDGGGVLLASVTEGVTMAATAARRLKIRKTLAEEQKSNLDEYYALIGKCVAYASTEGHYCIRKVANIMGFPVRIVEVDDTGAMRQDHLTSAIQMDKESGLLPFFCYITVGTVGRGTSENISSIGKICQEWGLWLDVDASYAGNLCICPEYQYLLEGIQLASSLHVSPHKGLGSLFCSCLWLQKRSQLVTALSRDIDLEFYEAQGENNQEAMGYIQAMQLPTAKTGRALKLWFMFNLLGVEGMQKRMRKYIEVAHYFRKLVLADGRFELAKSSPLIVTCFRFKDDNDKTSALWNKIRQSKRIMLMEFRSEEHHYIRYVPSHTTEIQDVETVWAHINQLADDTHNTCI